MVKDPTGLRCHLLRNFTRGAFDKEVGLEAIEYLAGLMDKI
jgi:hypothetical protein